MNMIPLEVEIVFSQYLLHTCPQSFFFLLLQNLNSETLRQVELGYWERRVSTVILTVACLFIQAGIHCPLWYLVLAHISQYVHFCLQGPFRSWHK